MDNLKRHVSVIICAYTEKRWEDLVAAIASVRQQTLPATEIIVVIDHNPQLLKRVRDHISEVIVIENTGIQGLSSARNSGIAVAKSQIVAFLDDDAVAIPDWLEFLCQGFEDPEVLGVGGPVIPYWQTHRPSWVPEEFLWVVGCTYRGMPETSSLIRNPIGANMSFRREVFDTIGGFQKGIGRIGTRPLGCEETELCIRAQQYWPMRGFLYQPQASVFHHVPDTRTSWSYFFSRCYSEGLSKAFISRYVGVQDSLASERAYTFSVLPQGVLHGLIDTFIHRDYTGFARAWAISSGLATTLAGYLIGRYGTRTAKSKEDVAIRGLAYSGSETSQLHNKDYVKLPEQVSKI